MNDCKRRFRVFEINRQKILVLSCELYLLDTYPHGRERMSEGLPFIWAEVCYAVHFEPARSITDVLARRVRMAAMDKLETKKVLDKARVEFQIE